MPAVRMERKRRQPVQDGRKTGPQARPAETAALSRTPQPLSRPELIATPNRPQSAQPRKKPKAGDIHPRPRLNPTPTQPGQGAGALTLRIGQDAVFRSVNAHFLLLCRQAHAHRYLEDKEHQEAGAQGPSQHYGHTD